LAYRKADPIFAGHRRRRQESKDKSKPGEEKEVKIGTLVANKESRTKGADVLDSEKGEESQSAPLIIEENPGE